MKARLLINTCSILFVVLLISQSGTASPYASIFGQNSTAWVFRWANLFGAVIDSAYIEKDTIVSGISYKKVIIKPNNPIFKGGLLREDVSTGEVWYRDIDYSHSLNPNDTIERVMYDFSLLQGDTFNITNETFHSGHADSFAIVDSVRIIDGLKYIYFNSKFNTGEPYTVIEGIGCNVGILSRHFPSAISANYLLCSYKDNAKTSFKNVLYKGDCHPPLSIQETPVRKNDIGVFPNPVSNYLHLENNSTKQISKIRITSLQGIAVKEVAQPGLSGIPVGEIPAGYYFLNIYWGEGEVLIRPLSIQH